MEMFFLNESNINLAFDIRRQIFIEEQNVTTELEIDGSDEYAKNMILMVNNKPIGTGRLIVVDDKMYIGRVAILKQYRKNGYATHIMKFLINESQNLGYKEIFIYTQSYAKNFYEKLGFKSFGDEFLEANIPHIHMKLTF